MAHSLLKLFQANFVSDTRGNQTLDFCNFLKKLLLEFKCLLSLLIAELIDYLLNFRDIRLRFETLHNKLLYLHQLLLITLSYLCFPVQFPYGLQLALSVGIVFLDLSQHLLPQSTNLLVSIS